MWRYHLSGGNEEKIKSLLGLNLPMNIVATAVGVQESEVALLMEQPEFNAAVVELRVESITAGAQRDKQIDGLEGKLIQKLEEAIDCGIPMQPALVARLFQIVNAAKRRATPEHSLDAAPRQALTLVLPNCIAAQFIVNPKNQVIEVEGRTIATMPAGAVNKKLEELRKGESVNVSEHQQDEEHARKRLAGLVKLSHLPLAEIL